MKVDIFSTAERYGVICADPPWKQSKGGRKAVRAHSSGLPLDYRTIPLEEIESHLRTAVGRTEPNSVLFLWTIDKYLFEAQAIAERLGYKLHARMVWNKVNGIPAAFTIRYGHEYLLFMYRGKLRPVAIACSQNAPNGTAKSRESPTRLWSGYTLPKRSSNFMRGVNVQDGTAGETRYER